MRVIWQRSPSNTANSNYCIAQNQMENTENLEECTSTNVEHFKLERAISIIVVVRCFLNAYHN